MTLKGWSYTEIMNMPESERVKWALKCNEHHERMEEEAENAKRM